MLRFLALAVPTAVAILIGVGVAATTLGVGVDLGPLAERGIARPEPLAPVTTLTIAAFEAVALVALFLLVEGRSGSPLADGLAAGAAAWLFRGPLLVATIATLTRLPTEPFWQSARIALVALPVAGVALGALARRKRPPR